MTHHRRPSGDRRARRANRLAWAALGLALVLAACTSTPSVAPTVAPSPEPTPTTTTYELGTSVWYEGLVLTFETATAVLDARGGPVTVVVDLQNPGADDQTLDAPIKLVAGGTSYDPARESVMPSVPATGTAYTTLKFNTFGLTSADGAVLRIGRPDRHQGVVPFTPGGPTAVILKPVPFAIKGATTASDMHLVLSGALLRWDLPDWADELPASSASLTVSYTVTYTGTFSGGVPFTGDNVRLSLPNGKVLAARPDGHSQSVGAILPGQTLRGLSTRFEIPFDLPGKYTLELIENGITGKIVFTLPG